MRTDAYFSAADWAAHRDTWLRFWNHDLERPLCVAHSWKKDGPEKMPPWMHWIMGRIPHEIPADEVADAAVRGIANQILHGDAWPKWHPNYGPGSIAAHLGCTLEADDHTTWFKPGRFQGQAIADIRLAYDADERWWRRCQEITSAVARRAKGTVNVSHADIGGNLDILASVRDSQQLLLDCMDDADEVARLAGDITRLWLVYYEDLRQRCLSGGADGGISPWATIWSPTSCYMLQSDFAYMISPRQFKRFVAPDIAACCDRLDHSMYHLDGKGQLPHLDQLLAIPRLGGIQWIPGEGLPHSGEAVWLPVLKRIRDAGKLVQLYLPPEGAMRIVRELGGKGFVFHLFVDGAEADAAIASIQREAAARRPVAVAVG
jgi:5-methyltetrahydrofolate--homocysteine methyltransferase